MSQQAVPVEAIAAFETTPNRIDMTVYDVHGETVAIARLTLAGEAELLTIIERAKQHALKKGKTPVGLKLFMTL